MAAKKGRTTNAARKVSPPSEVTDLGALVDEQRAKLSPGRLETLAMAEDLRAGVGLLRRRLVAEGLAGAANRGPDEMDAVRAMSSTVDVVDRGLLAIAAWLEHGDNWPLWRAEFIRARNIIRGGSNGGGAHGDGYDQGLAIDMAQQGLGMALGVGFAPARGADALVEHVRDTFAELFGEVFADAPSDETIRAHVSPGSRAVVAVEAAARESVDGVAPKSFYTEFRAVALLLARDVLWAGFEEAKRRGAIIEKKGEWPQSASPRLFRFQMTEKDVNARAFLKRLQSRKYRPRPSQ